jgi:hypothetical protein
MRSRRYRDEFGQPFDQAQDEGAENVRLAHENLVGLRMMQGFRRDNL